MLNFIKKYLRIHFGFSKSESRGTMVLLFLVATVVSTGSIVNFLNNREVFSKLSTEESLYLNEELNKLEPKHSSNHSITSTDHKKKIYLKNNNTTLNNKSINVSHHTKSKQKITKRTKKTVTIKKFNINTATVKQLQQTIGIGKVLSGRIIKFRNKLGGFVSTSQYHEVYGLQPNVVEKLKKNSFLKKSFIPNKIYINTATISELMRHPYIDFEYAKSIVRHREQIGVFDSKKSFINFTEKSKFTHTKILPYICLKNL